MGYGLIDAHTHLMFASLPQLAVITQRRQLAGASTYSKHYAQYSEFTGYSPAPQSQNATSRTILLPRIRNDDCTVPLVQLAKKLATEIVDHREALKATIASASSLAFGICSSNRASSVFQVPPPHRRCQAASLHAKERSS
jgi:hypothetical protein